VSDAPMGGGRWGREKEEMEGNESDFFGNFEMPDPCMCFFIF
jgi:hypothetical protein